MDDIVHQPEVAAASARVVFVCHLNTRVSPMAAALLAARLPGVQVSSAGASRYAARGYPASDAVRDEMRHRDAIAAPGAQSKGPLSTYIDGHRSVMLTLAETKDADVVVCFPPLRAFIIRECYGVEDARDWDVEDPVGGCPPPSYRACADALDDLVAALAHELEGRG